MRERRGEVRSIKEVAPGVLAIDIAALEPSELRFLPGQFASIAVGDGQRRSFSIASMPRRRDGFDLLVKPYGQGMTARYLTQLKAGDEVRFFGPMGYFFYEPGAADEIVFAATGVGISAIWSMMLAALDDGRPKHIRLFWGNRNLSDVFWKEHLEELAARDPRFLYDIRLSNTGDGHITPHVIATATPAAPPIYYLCGSSLMIKAITAGLEEAGVPAPHVRTEAFYG